MKPKIIQNGFSQTEEHSCKLLIRLAVWWFQIISDPVRNKSLTFFTSVSFWPPANTKSSFSVICGWSCLISSYVLIKSVKKTGFHLPILSIQKYYSPKLCSQQKNILTSIFWSWGYSASLKALLGSFMKTSLGGLKIYFLQRMGSMLELWLLETPLDLFLMPGRSWSCCTLLHTFFSRQSWYLLLAMTFTSQLWEWQLQQV